MGLANHGEQNAHNRGHPGFSNHYIRQSDISETLALKEAAADLFVPPESLLIGSLILGVWQHLLQINSF
jgi:hypothetical protein